MRSRLVVPLVCFVLGGYLGFKRGAALQPIVASSNAEGKSGADSFSAGQGEAAMGKNTVATGGFSQSLDDLTKDYNAKVAEKLSRGLSVPEIQQALRRLQSQKEQWSLRSQLFSAWAAKDPEAAWTAALALSEEEGRDKALSAVASEIAKTRPETAIDLAMSLGPGQARQRALDAGLSAWAKDNLPSALDYLNRHPDLPVQEDTLANAMSRLAKENPMQAAQQAVMINPSNSREFAIQSVLHQWYIKDAEAAKRWALEQTDPVLRNAAVEALITAMALDNPRAALAFVSENSFSGIYDAQNEILRSWLEKDPAGTFDYLATNPLDENDAPLTYHIVSALIRATPEEREALLAKLSEGEFKHSIIGALAVKEAGHGRYAKAVSELNGLPDSPHRDSSLQQLGTTWAKNDPQSAAEWLKLQPDSTDRDLVMSGYATTLSTTDPQAAIQWAKAIPDPQIQGAVFKNIAVRWLRSNPQSAMPWLNSLNLSERERNSVIQSAHLGSDITFSFEVKERR